MTMTRIQSHDQIQFHDQIQSHKRIVHSASRTRSRIALRVLQQGSGRRANRLQVMDVHDLLDGVDLPKIRQLKVLTDSAGIDNTLTLITLADGRQLVARQPVVAGELGDQAPRAAFLERQHIGFPKVYATAADGSSLVEWISGTTLADYISARHPAARTEDDVWQWLGASLAAVHAVKFPRPLQGPVGPKELTLTPQDPVDDLQQSLVRARRWIGQRNARLAIVPDRLGAMINEHAEAIRAEQPCLLHGDNNLDNFVVTDHDVRIIDWDYPCVGYPLAELSALDEHVYLNGIAEGLPASFWRAYGRTYPRELMLLYRAIGCMNWLAGDDWDGFQNNPGIIDTTRRRLRSWQHLLTDWVDTLPQQLSDS